MITSIFGVAVDSNGYTPLSSLGRGDLFSPRSCGDVFEVLECEGPSYVLKCYSPVNYGSHDKDGHVIFYILGRDAEVRHLGSPLPFVQEIEPRIRANNSSYEKTVFERKDEEYGKRSNKEGLQLEFDFYESAGSVVHVPLSVSERKQLVLV